MNNKLKIALSIIGGIVGTIAVFCLVVVIGCAANGLTFGQQICDWFGNNANTIASANEIIAEHAIMKG